eukprot:10190644-Alexandrium_andersonii.AAC.1
MRGVLPSSPSSLEVMPSKDARPSRGGAALAVTRGWPSASEVRGPSTAGTAAGSVSQSLEVDRRAVASAFTAGP